jgi:hypothetical protein
MQKASRPAWGYYAYRAWDVTGRYGVHEAIIVVCSFLVYFSIRAAVASRGGEAFANAYDIIALERHLGLYHELTMQSWILDRYWAIRLANTVYFWGHMPTLIFFAVWLYTQRRGSYFVIRNAFLASGFVAVIIYATYPLAPPRLMPLEGFIDTMAIYDRLGYNAQETEAFVNQYAAMPSLHFGWSMLIGGAVAVVSRSMITAIAGILWPVAMFFSIVMTANHFIVDAIAGGIVALIGLAIAFGIRRAQRYAVQTLTGRLARQPAREVEGVATASGSRGPNAEL